MSKNVLVIAAHPDDEVLGCGASMAKHALQGDKVGVLFVADGIGARNNSFEGDLQKRKAAAHEALKILGAEALDFLDFPDNRLDSVPLLDIVQKIESMIAQFSPEIVYTHHHGDLNIDHAVVHRATMTACRPLPGSRIKEVYAYEVLSATDWSLGNSLFSPNVFVNIGEFWDKKADALMCYVDEMRSFPHTRSLESLDFLSRHRGATMGLERAEAFSTIRMLR
jgi:LmbE family N-acetylglucosaminyl deacetylase